MPTAPPAPANAPSASDFNMLAPELRADPYPYYAALRRESPIHPLAKGLPVFALSRYEDVVHVVHRPELFSSSAIQAALQGGGAGSSVSSNSGALAGHRLFEAPMMIGVDPPKHLRLRKIVNRGFTPRRIASLEPRIREIANHFLDEALERGELELVRDLSVPLPVTVIAEMLGVESERHRDFKRWSDTTVIGLSGASDEITPEAMREAADEMADYVTRMIAERRRAPKDDLISVLVEAEEGDALSTEEVLSFIFLLLVAGNETTTNLIGNGVKALLAHPDQMGKVANDPTRIPSFVEEVVRYDSPIQGLPRLANQDVTLPSGDVAAGATLLVFFAAANRDDAQFPGAEQFDVDRNPQGHVGFGHGIHYCLGASLARLEAKVAFECLFARCRNLELAADTIPLVDSLILRGPKRMPLHFEAA